MIPLLQRCYGGDPTAWLEMPRYLLTAYVQMYPRVLASDQIRSLSMLMLAQGDTKKPQWKRAVAELERTARGEHGVAQRRTATQQEISAFLGMMPPAIVESAEVDS